MNLKRKRKDLMFTYNLRIHAVRKYVSTVQVYVCVSAYIFCTTFFFLRFLAAGEHYKHTCYIKSPIVIYGVVFPSVIVL